MVLSTHDFLKMRLLAQKLTIVEAPLPCEPHLWEEQLFTSELSVPPVEVGK
jgi:hypothetical protein